MDAAEPTPEDLSALTPRPAMEPHEAFRELGQLVLGEEPLARVLHRVAELAKACLPGRQDVSVTLVDGDQHPTTVGFTGPLASALDERQDESGYGPCLDAAYTGESIRVDDTSADNPYQDSTEIAARQGGRSTVSVGMPMPQRLLGGLNVHVDDDEPLDDHDLEVLQIFSRYASIALADHSSSTSSVSLSTHLQTALPSRAVIEQAKGILMARTGCTAEEAFTVLAERSQRSNRTLRDVATDVAASTGPTWQTRDALSGCLIHGGRVG